MKRGEVTTTVHAPIPPLAPVLQTGGRGGEVGSASSGRAKGEVGARGRGSYLTEPIWIVDAIVEWLAGVLK